MPKNPCRKCHYDTQSKDGVKVITVRGTAFEAAKADGGSAAPEKAPDAQFNADISSLLSRS